MQPHPLICILPVTVFIFQESWAVATDTQWLKKLRICASQKKFANLWSRPTLQLLVKKISTRWKCVFLQTYSSIYRNRTSPEDRNCRSAQQQNSHHVEVSILFFCVVSKIPVNEPPTKEKETLITWIFVMIELPLAVCREPMVNSLLRLTFIKLGPFFYDSVWIIFTALVRSSSQRLSPKLRAPRSVPGNGLSSRGILIELRLHNKGKNQLHAHNRWSSPFTLTP